MNARPASRRVIFSVVTVAMAIRASRVRKGEQQSERVFGHRIRRIGRHANHGETQRNGGCKIHIIKNPRSARPRGARQFVTVFPSRRGCRGW